MDEKGSLKPRKSSSSTKTLNDSIQLLCAELDKEVGTKESYTKLSQKFQIKRRRLYDVSNVLLSTGICMKGESDTIMWFGKERIYPTMTKLFKERGVGDPNKTLDELFPIETCVGIPNLTVNFLLIYFALEVKCLDIRMIALFFSRGTTRMKTTLSKLYQISYILCAIGITRRNTQVCEVLLNDTLYETVLENNEICLRVRKNKNGPLALENLLSRPILSFKEAATQRRDYFGKFYVDSAAKPGTTQQF